MDVQFALGCAERIGFSHFGPVNTKKLELFPEVREMCTANKCGKFNTCWTCPPACGTLTQLQEQVHRYTAGILVQTTGALEDDFDVEAMLKTEKVQKKRFSKLAEMLRAIDADCLPLSAGSCEYCASCAYPDPCRFPEKAICSMEAYGIFVSQLCADSGIDYYYGKRTITYSGCILFRDEEFQSV